MPSSFTAQNRLEEQNPGENLNTWGSRLNANTTALIDFAISGYTALSISGPVTLTSANGAADQARSAILDFTSGTGGTVTIPGVSHVYQVRNNTSGGVVFTTGSGAAATVEPGSVATVICDGTNCYRFADAADIAACLAAAETYADGLAFESSSGNLPAQAGNAGNFLTTNGATANWAAPLPNQTGMTGAVLQTNGSSASWNTGVSTSLANVSTSLTGVSSSATMVTSSLGNVSSSLTGVSSSVAGLASSLSTTNSTVSAVSSAVGGGAALFTQSQSNGTGPADGSISSNTWTTRVVNTATLNTISGASLASNQITLPAGTYEVFAQQAINVNNAGSMQSQWTSSTGGAPTVTGLNARSPNSSGAAITLLLQGKFSITGTSVYFLQCYSGASGTTGGSAVSSGNTETYVSIYLRKIA